MSDSNAPITFADVADDALVTLLASKANGRGSNIELLRSFVAADVAGRTARCTDEATARGKANALKGAISNPKRNGEFADVDVWATNETVVLVRRSMIESLRAVK